MTRPTLQVDQDNALGLAKARSAAVFLVRFRLRTAFEAQDIRERQTEQAEAADAKQVAARHAVTRVTADETGDDQHGFSSRQGEFRRDDRRQAGGQSR